MAAEEQNNGFDLTSSTSEYSKRFAVLQFANSIISNVAGHCLGHPFDTIRVSEKLFISTTGSQTS